jgi:hypothetical protein
LILIANPLEDEPGRDSSLAVEPFVMEEAVSVVADHCVGIQNRIVKAGPSVKTSPGGFV